MDQNKNREVRISKVTLNIGAGDDKQRIEKATKLLELLTGRKPVVTKSRKRSTFGVPKGKPLGSMITLRGQDAHEFLKRALAGVENKVKLNQIDDQGNFTIGIKEYIDMPQTKYSQEVGVIGLDVSVTLERRGFRIARRRIQKRKIPAKQKINKEETAEWLKKNYGVELT